MRLIAEVQGAPSSWLGDVTSNLEFRLMLEQFSKKVLYTSRGQINVVTDLAFNTFDKAKKELFTGFLESIPLSMTQTEAHDFCLGQGLHEASTMHDLLEDQQLSSKFAVLGEAVSAKPGQATTAFLEHTLLPLARLSNRIEILDPFAASALVEGNGTFLEQLLTASKAPIVIKSVYPKAPMNHFWSVNDASSAFNISLRKLVSTRGGSQTRIESHLSERSPMIHDRAIRFRFHQSSLSFGLTNSIGVFSKENISAEIKIFNQPNSLFHQANKQWRIFSSHVRTTVDGAE